MLIKLRLSNIILKYEMKLQDEKNIVIDIQIREEYC